MPYLFAMDKFSEFAPIALQVLGFALLWTLKASWFVVAVAIILAWNVLRVMLSALFFGRLPRSYIRVFD